MALNPYFQQGARSEQNLVQDLINEQLRMYGVEVHYMPRKYVKENTVIREVVQSKFDDAYPLEAYVDTYDGYGDNPILLTKFGIEATNEITLTISRERWENYIEPLMENEPDVKLTTRPKEGDLIYFPLGDRLFEIKFVEHEKPFYQLQKNYVYELRCELFRYEDEVIDTGVEEIDNELVGDNVDGTSEDGIPTILGPTQTFTLVGAASTAAAYTGIVTSGGINYFSITNRGGGYITPPTIGLSSAPSGGTTGIATAVLIAGIQYCDLNISLNQKSVQSIEIANPGAGYTVAPGVAFTSDTGVGAAATAYIADGTLGVVTVTSAGGGFVTAPTVTFAGPTGVGTTATAVAVINAAGSVTDVRFTNTGAGYTAGDLPLTATFSTPATGSEGDYRFNETVTGAISGATGKVRTWDSVSNILEVSSISGTFSLGENITGSLSGAVHALRIVNTDPTDDGFADNINIETEADSILDFTEQNPFGMP